MGSKNEPGKFDCYENAMPDEPMFILLARDPDAPRLVREWADGRMADIRASKRPPSDVAMVDEALKCSEAMEKWRAANDGKWRALTEGQ